MSAAAPAPAATSPADARRRKRTYSGRVDSTIHSQPQNPPEPAGAHACDTRAAMNCVGGSADDIHDDHDVAVDARYLEHESAHTQRQERRIRSKIQELCEHEQTINAHVYEIYPERWQELLSKAAALADARVASMRESQSAFFFHVGTCVNANAASSQWGSRRAPLEYAKIAHANAHEDERK